MLWFGAGEDAFEFFHLFKLAVLCVDSCFVFGLGGTW